MKIEFPRCVLILSFLFSLIIPASYLGLLERFYGYDWFEVVLNESIFIFFIFIFSFISYLAPERVLVSWWKFARIAIPAVFIFSLIINLELHHSPSGQMQGVLDAPALGMLYLIFTIGSLIQIWRGWRSV